MDPNEYVARTLLQVKNETALLTFLTTLWLGTPVMVFWDKLNGGIIQLWGGEDMSDSEVLMLEKIIEQCIGS